LNLAASVQYILEHISVKIFALSENLSSTVKNLAVEKILELKSSN
jgi:hypothetical protein